MQCISSLQYLLVLCDPTVQNSELIGWVPHSDILQYVRVVGVHVHPHQRLPREEEGYVERGAQAHVAGGNGRGKMESEGLGWMRMSERVG